MSLEASGVQSEGRYAHANGTDIYYVEAGKGEPLLLLHGGVVSTNPVWAGHPWAYVSHMDTLASTSVSLRPTREGTAGRSTRGVAQFRTPS
jgi:hypothetical protein